jgi:hypothetical protein
MIRRRPWWLSVRRVSRLGEAVLVDVTHVSCPSLQGDRMQQLGSR